MSSDQIKLITSLEEGAQVCAELTKAPKICIDCEGQGLGKRNGKVTLVQVEFRKIYLFDIMACEGLIRLLQPILESNTILKIIHDCRSERATLKAQFGISLTNVFDTQIAFHFFKPMDKLRMPFTRIINYYKIPYQNPLKKKFTTEFYLENPDFWSRRPLTEEMINYAAADVRPLYEIYKKLKRFERNAEFRNMCAEAIVEPEDYEEPVRMAKLREFH